MRIGDLHSTIEQEKLKKAEQTKQLEAEMLANKRGQGSGSGERYGGRGGSGSGQKQRGDKPQERREKQQQDFSSPGAKQKRETAEMGGEKIQTPILSKVRSIFERFSRFVCSCSIWRRVMRGCGLDRRRSLGRRARAVPNRWPPRNRSALRIGFTIWILPQGAFVARCFRSAHSVFV